MYISIQQNCNKNNAFFTTDENNSSSDVKNKYEKKAAQHFLIEYLL